MKNWDKIVKELSSPESSDAEDDLNVMSVQKNAKRVAELMHGVIPTLDSRKKGAPPKGMNRTSVLRDQLTKSFVESQRSIKPPSMSEGAIPNAPPSSPAPAPAQTRGDNVRPRAATS